MDRQNYASEPYCLVGILLFRQRLGPSFTTGGWCQQGHAAVKHNAPINNMQPKQNNETLQCSSVLAPRVLRANRVTRKKPNMKMSKVKPMTTAGKAPWESSGVEEKLTRKSQAKFRMATVNVGSMVGRSAEVTERLGRRNVDIAALQDVRNKNEGTKILRGNDFVYKLFWKGEKNGQRGVGIMVKQEVVESVTEVRRVSPRILSVDLALSEKVVTIISVYCPQRGRNVEEKEKL